MPKVLLRLPYGPDTVVAEGFDFHEAVDGYDASKYLTWNISLKFVNFVVPWHDNRARTLRTVEALFFAKTESGNATLPKLELAIIPGIPALKAAQEICRQIDSFAFGGRETTTENK